MSGAEEEVVEVDKQATGTFKAIQAGGNRCILWYVLCALYSAWEEQLETHC